MAFTSEFVPLELSQLRREAAVMKADGWRFIQTHAVNTDNGIDLYYSFMKDGKVVNLRIEGVTKDQQVPSITDLFLAAFVFENEARELFGVDMRDIAIDFQGAMYAPAVSEPMTFISPEQKAAREKAAKVAAAKAAKAAQAAAEDGAGDAAASGASGGGKRVFRMTPELQARLDAKMPTLSDEKKAKVEAALKARAAEAEAASLGSGSPSASEKPGKPQPEAQTAGASESAKSDSEAKTQAQSVPARDKALEDKLAAMDPAKAAKVRAALEGKPAGQDSSAASAGEDGKAALNGAGQAHVDAQVERLMSLMDEEKAARVQAALAE